MRALSFTSNNTEKTTLSCSRREVLVLSDTHGKDLTMVLQIYFTANCDIFNLCRPGAGYVLNDANKFAESNNIEPRCRPIISLSVGRT